MTHRLTLTAILLSACLAMISGQVSAVPEPSGPAAAGPPAKASATATVPAKAPAAPLGAPADSPAGKVVYQSGFAKSAGPEWWPRWTDKTPAGARPFLGEFGIEPVTFALKDLPAHKFVRVSMSLFMLRPSDGSSLMWGPDTWEMSVAGGPRLVYATFDNCCFFRDNNEQSFPDEFPWAIHRGWTGASEKQTLGYIYEWTGNTTQDTSSVYRLVLVFPHEDKDLRLLLRALWTEPVKVGGESWGMESFKVETLDGPAALSADDMEDAWLDLAGEDSRPAFSALWKLVGAGDKAVEFIAGRVGKPTVPRVKAEAKPATPEDELPGLLKKMDDANFQIRQEATKRLVEIGLPLLDTLRQEAGKAESPEVRMRLRQAIEQLEAKKATAAAVAARPGWWPLPPQDFQVQRIARVLETIGSPEALALLDRLARGDDKKLAPWAAASRRRLAERTIDRLLAQADAASTGADPRPATAQARCDEAAKVAKAYSPEDEVRVAGMREDIARRAKARAVPIQGVLRTAMIERLVVADDPAGAFRMVDNMDDRKALALAAKPLDELSLEELAALRAFYLKEAKTAGAAIQADLVARALTAARPGAEPTEKPFDPTEGMDGGLLASYLSREAEHGRWAELLPLFDLPRLGPKEGNAVPNQMWKRAWHGLKGGNNPPPVFLPVQPDGAYQVRLVLIPYNLDYVCVRVPVGDRHVPVMLHANGDLEIQATADKDGWASGKWAEANINYGYEYVTDVTVRPQAGGTVAVNVTIDGQPVAEWKGKAADIRPLDEAAAPKGSPSVTVAGPAALIRSAAVRMIEGKAKIVAVKQAAAPPADPDDGSDPPP